MRIVIDTNRIIAALISAGASRKILFNENYYFITPDHSILEIYGHEKEISKKACISYAEFDILMTLIFERIEIIPESEYASFIHESRKLISDIDDVPFIAWYLER